MAIELTDYIRDKVRETLMLTLPDDKLDELIQTEINKFFNGGKDGYGHDIPSPFSAMIGEEFKARAKQSIVKWMDINFETTWEGNSERFLGEAVKKFVPIVLEALATGIASEALSEIQHQLRSGTY